MFLEIDPEKHKDFVIGEGRNKVLHVNMMKALCGMLMVSIFCCNKFRKDIEAEVYKVNPCDVCVANKIKKASNVL